MSAGISAVRDADTAGSKPNAMPVAVATAIVIGCNKLFKAPRLVYMRTGFANDATTYDENTDVHECSVKRLLEEVYLDLIGEER